MHFGDRPNTLPHEDRMQGKEEEKEAQKRERVEGGRESRGREGGR